MATKEQEREAAEILALPKDIESIRERRYVVKDILNTFMLTPEARAAYEQLYGETGKALERAARSEK